MLSSDVKKTTRNYIRLLVANTLLIGAVSVFWHMRISTGILATDKKLPDASYLADLTRPAKLSDHKGQWLVLNLWATWCGPCLMEIPGLEELREEYKNKGLQVIAISLDEVSDAAELNTRLDRLHLPAFTHNWDNKGEVANALPPEGLPTTYIVDPAGNIRDKFEGDRDWGSDSMRAYLDKLMAPVEAPSKK